MADVFVVAAAMVPMGKYPAASYAGLGAPTVRRALSEAGIDRSRVEVMYCGHSFGGLLVGQRIAKDVCLRGIPVINVENACSGGATALHAAFNAIRNEEYTVACVTGVDKLTQFGGSTIPLVAEDWEVRLGMVMPALYAMRAQRLLHERGTTLDDLALVSVKARAHGARNPFAQYQSTVTKEEVLASRVIADPLTLLQCCPTGDGAATVVLVSDDVRRDLDAPSVRVRSSSLRSGEVARGFRDMLWPEISAQCSAAAYASASVDPGDIDVVELHDAFSVAELLYYEALGLAEKGRGHELIRSGATTYGGDVIVNPSGGLLAKGHPVGATGVAQIAEIYWQLTDQAGDRQVPDARLGMTHATGGGISGLDHGACTVHILERAAS